MTNLLATLLFLLLQTNSFPAAAPSGQDWFITNVVQRTDVIAYTIGNKVEIVTNVVVVSTTIRRFTGEMAWKEVPLEADIKRKPLGVPDAIKQKIGLPPLPPGLILKDKP